MVCESQSEEGYTIVTLEAGRHSAVSARLLAGSLATPNDHFPLHLPNRMPLDLFENSDNKPINDCKAGTSPAAGKRGACPTTMKRDDNTS